MDVVGEHSLRTQIFSYSVLMKKTGICFQPGQPNMLSLFSLCLFIWGCRYGLWEE